MLEVFDTVLSCCLLQLRQLFMLTFSHTECVCVCVLYVVNSDQTRIGDLDLKNVQGPSCLGTPGLYVLNIWWECSV